MTSASAMDGVAVHFHRIREFKRKQMLETITDWDDLVLFYLKNADTNASFSLNYSIEEKVAQERFVAIYGLGENKDVNIVKTEPAGNVVVLFHGVPFGYPRFRGDFIQFFSLNFSFRIEFPVEWDQEARTCVIEEFPSQLADSNVTDAEILDSDKWLSVLLCHVVQQTPTSTAASVESK